MYKDKNYMNLRKRKLIINNICLCSPFDTNKNHTFSLKH